MKKLSLKQKLINIAFDANDWLANHMSFKKIHNKHKSFLKYVNKQNEQYNKDIALAKQVISENKEFQRKINDTSVVIFYPDGSSTKFN